MVDKSTAAVLVFVYVMLCMYTAYERRVESDLIPDEWITS